MICTKCKIDRKNEDFYVKNVETGKRKTQCKFCHSEYRKQKYIENKEKELKQVNEYRLKNPEKYSPEFRKKQKEKYKNYSKKAGRIYESNCIVCKERVYLTKKELDSNYKRFCSLDCKKTTFKTVYELYYSDINKRCKGDCVNNITADYLKNLLEIKQNNKCNVTGLPIRLYNSNEKKNLYNSASLDRIDSSKWYIEENVQWVCLGVNYMKMNYSNEELLKTIKLIRTVV